MVYDIVNPSDPYTMDAPDLATALSAVCLLGEGRYGLRDRDGAVVVPVFLFGGHDEWARANFDGKDLEAVLASVSFSAVADCLDSCVIGGFTDRETFERGAALIDDPEKRATWRAEWLDRKRTSLNDIGGRAAKLAAHLRKLPARRT